MTQTSHSNIETSHPNIQTSLANVMEDVRQVAKSDRNTQQGFTFRGIDSVVNAVAPALRKHNVIVVPTVEDYAYETVTIGRNQTQMGHVRLKVIYTFHGPAGDSIAATVVGEAMDSGDKATAKAMSVCFRTALLQALALPTDEVDPDAVSYERAPKKTSGLAEAEHEMRSAKTLEELDAAAAKAKNAGMSEEDRYRLKVVYIARKAIVSPAELVSASE